MKPSKKIRVAVLYGGRSSEHEVSVRSAANVIKNLDTSRFDVVPIGIDKQGHWLLGHDVFMQSLEKQNVPKKLAERHAWFTPEWVSNQDRKQQSKEMLPDVQFSGMQFDVIFPVVHGTYCEDGTLQGLLELADIPYVGCGVLASSMGMDKDISKRLVSHAGVHVAPYISVKHLQWKKDPKHFCDLVAKQLSYPVFVKPANTGSSIGISKVKTADQLVAAVDEAFKFDTKILIEQGVNALELEMAVLESLDAGVDPIVSVVGEIKPTHEFYSYEAKYVDENGAELLIPASVTDKVKEQARVMARDIFKALECEGFARVDLFYDKDTQQLVFNEINTLPGFTQISMYPKLMEASGMPYQELLTHLVELAIKRHDHKRQLIRSYNN